MLKDSLSSLLAREKHLKATYQGIRRRKVEYPRADQVLRMHPIRMDLEKVRRELVSKRYRME
jgi:hypothetical protein